MSACEKCWEDARALTRINGKDQGINYKNILSEREYNHCSPEEQAGQFWDEEKQKDRRV